MILGLIGLGILLIAWENLRGKKAVVAYKTQLVALGEKLSIDELTPATSVAARSAANELIQAAWRLNSGTMVPTTMPGAMRMTSPGKAAVAWAQTELRDPGGTTNTWETLGADLARNSQALGEIRGILKHPAFDSGLNYRQGFNLQLPALAKRKSIAQWLSADTVYRLHTGELDLALADFSAILSLSNTFRDEPLLISQLVRFAITAIAIAPTWEALQADGWTDAQLAELQAGWESLKFMPSMEQAIQMERAMGLETFDRLRRSSFERQLMFSGSLVSAGGSPPALAPPNSASEIPEFASQLGEKTLSAAQQFGQEKAWLWLWSYRDEMRYLEVTQTMLEVARESDGGRPFVGRHAAGTSRLEQAWKNSAGSPAYFLSLGLAPALEKASSKAARVEAQRVLAIAAIALKRYQLRHGQQASTLASLVPEFLPRPPTDFMDGKELRYRPIPDGTFLLYSVNDNGTDDGGDPRPLNETTTSRYFGIGRDMVWPTAATREEIAAEETRRQKR